MLGGLGVQEPMATQSGPMQTQFQSRLTSPLKAGGIKPSKSGMKEEQTKACGDKGK